MVRSDWQNVFKESALEALGNFSSWNDRIHWVYLGTSLIMAIGFYFFSKSKKNLLTFLFPKKNFLSATAFVDYCYLFFNSFIKIVVIAPFMIWSLQIAFDLKEFLLAQFGFVKWDGGKVLTYTVYGIGWLVISDFSVYLIHLMFHKIPFLWVFHKVHHSATALNPITQYRIHPVELIVNNLRALVVTGGVNGLASYFFEGQVVTYTILGVTIAQFLFLAFGANLRHSHIPFKYWDWLESVLISPYQHQIHHSAQEHLFDKNMGSKLAIWDKLFGTLVKSKEVKDLEIGLGKEDAEFDSFFKTLYKPFVQIFYKKKTF